MTNSYMGVRMVVVSLLKNKVIYVYIHSYTPYLHVGHTGGPKTTMRYFFLERVSKCLSVMVW